ncbi:MAG: plasmid mobilization relaxosome protein MobC [Roseburia sp.]|nr:plasmid mobilization relaxosome protein MobC [Roseburia sp.]
MAKEVRKTFRMTYEQAQTLATRAEEAGMSEAEYVRLLVTQKPMDYPEIQTEVHNLVNEVNRVGVNINEVVHNNNSQLYNESDKERLIAYMRKLNELLSRKVKDIGDY